MKKIVICLALIAVSFGSVGQANYLSAPNYWTQLIDAFYKQKTEIWTPKYQDEDERSKRRTSLRFSENFRASYKKYEPQKNNELYNAEAVLKVLVERSTNESVFLLKPSNYDWKIDTVHLEIIGELTEAEKEKMVVSGLNGRQNFDRFGRATLRAGSYLELQNGLQITNISTKKIKPIKIRILNVFLQNKNSKKKAKGLLSGNVMSRLLFVPPTKKKSVYASEKQDTQIVSKTVVPGENFDVLSFEYLPNYTSGYLKSVTIFEANKNVLAKHAIEKMELINAKTNEVLSTVKVTGSVVKFVFEDSITVNGSKNNTFRVRAYLQKNMPVITDSNELRWVINAADFLIVSASNGRPVHESNKQIRLKNATHFLEESRLQVFETASGIQLKNLGTKNSYLARTSFLLSDFKTSESKNIEVTVDGKILPHTKHFGGELLTIDFQNPVKVLPNTLVLVKVIRPSQKEVSWMIGEREALKDTVFKLKNASAHHIWTGSTNWYDLYQPTWMNGEYWEIFQQESLKK